MDLLRTIAITKLGAENLLDYGILEVLSECQYIDQHPKYDIELYKDGVFDINPHDRYNSIINHTFNVIAILITNFQDHILSGL